VGRHRRRRTGSWLEVRLRAVGALLLAGSAGIHLDLYLTGYRSIPVIGWLFGVQLVVGFLLAVAVLLTRSRLAAAASAAFALSTLSAYLLAVWIGLFGFREIRTRAGIAAGLIEVAAFGILVMAAIVADPVQQAAQQAEGPDGPGARMLARVQAALSMAIGGVGAVSLLALALLGVAVADAGTPPAAPAGTHVILHRADIGGVAVLTNASGFTLYWFGPDTATTSRCTGSCAAYWPPVSGTPRAGPGVTGKLGTIRRPGGGVQATYDGHPLYSYIGDNGPGVANGDNLYLNGGLWYEVRTTG
jgi:predicted lipoprotein with Yx(FWY)xxD motif